MKFFKRPSLAAIQLSLLALSAAGILAGISRNEMDTVFGKAVKICLECIGIG